MDRRWRLLLTCEHGGCRVPRAYRRFLDEKSALLCSHRGYDRGALPLARALARGLGAALIDAEVTRLLVDLNRSVGHPALHHPRIQQLSPAMRSLILARHYFPHRRRVEMAARSRLKAAEAAGGRLLHLAVHTFTPVLRGRRRTCDIGLLLDPRQPLERDFCRLWRRALRKTQPTWRVRLNDPYRGSDDGLTTTLRASFAGRPYLGIELEVNRRCLDTPQKQRRTGRHILASLLLALDSA